MKTKVLTLLGFAQKSGNVVSGSEIVVKTIDKGKVRLVFVGKDAAEGTTKKIILRCQRLNIPFYSELTVDELSGAIGKHNRTVVAITDKGFATQILSLISDMGI
ncbi:MULTISPECIES: ribosomal L7Ae/L30e/S12e/Gadd45 family protein [unclassified Fusibacter]|uniref:L7Ae/L30e/S12e/Gadd45 family ribosomal protein n=1 Tax=unclassified Fusibacter TaxID=2624464 RepID=UPI00101059DB|nr:MULTISPECIES: ribosomal L7Ae/L30e/S12e/Gadd45 family protein [unclassified Fusibacter]MCK8058802.1 ribosomal L7Ae/L30e/S12e/Gadd45 family protein [Fusibacter sp. A2]NPE21876.1 hypothetical protein [Fusibacter sp. A1]RXV61448.1 hypothetical protein DWB64_08530 [Fusibacter sp. A1]